MALKAIATKECSHFWDIEAKTSGELENQGRCRWCKEARMFPNTFEEKDGTLRHPWKIVPKEG